MHRRARLLSAVYIDGREKSYRNSNISANYWPFMLRQSRCLYRQLDDNTW